MHKTSYLYPKRKRLEYKSPNFNIPPKIIIKHKIRSLLSRGVMDPKT